MGFRLYVYNDNCPDKYDYCFGKCYGYNEKGELDSLKYLISINAFAEWASFIVSDIMDYYDMEDYFYHVPCTEPLTLTKEQYKTFIELYKKDICKLYNLESVEYDPLPESDTYVLEWG